MNWMMPAQSLSCDSMRGGCWAMQPSSLEYSVLGKIKKTLLNVVVATFVNLSKRTSSTGGIDSTPNMFYIFKAFVRLFRLINVLSFCLYMFLK